MDDTTTQRGEVPLPAGYWLWDPSRDRREFNQKIELPDAVRHGLVGQFLEIVQGSTEASPATLGIELVTLVGTMLGRSVMYRSGRIIQYPNMFVVVVGPSSFALKGVAAGEVRQLRERIDQEFDRNNVASGFASGEKLIHHIQDPIFDKNNVQLRGKSDQRLLIQQGEFSTILEVSNRDGSIFSSVLREAYDSVRLQTSSMKSDTAVVSNPHISVIGSITPEELSVKMGDLAMANGFGNRFLYVWSYADGRLPFGGTNVDVRLKALAGEIQKMIRAHKQGNPTVYELSQHGPGWTSEAKAKWDDMYDALSHPVEGGTTGALVRRGKPIVARLAIIYAALDGAEALELAHLEAALGWFDYSKATVERVFGDHIGIGKADELLTKLHEAGGQMSHSEISATFSNRLPAAERDQAIEALAARNLVIEYRNAPGGGRPSNVVAAIVKGRG